MTPENIDLRPQRRRQAIASAVTSGCWIIATAVVMLLLRARYFPAGIGSAVLAATAVLEVCMLIPLGFSLKARLLEIQGGEEDEARNY